jgi:predicted Rossmann-fold nucleotide-binding protein
MRALDPDLGAWLAAMPRAAELPFEVAPGGLYDVRDLYRGFDPRRPETLGRAFDSTIYRWTRERSGKARALSPAETIAARLHDTAMDRHVAGFLRPSEHKTVGIMGGHDVSRADSAFAGVARIARELARRRFKIVTGGGPGLMEAANLGAFMAPFADDRLGAALSLLAAAPSYGPDPAGDAADRAAWLAAAADVRTLVLGKWDAEPPLACISLGIPTWYYGAEPPNLFASAVGKYFFNSLREDGLVSLANAGIVFGRGAAGTVQEVFQSANLNFYRGAGVDATPMVFLDRAFWEGGAEDPPTSGRKPLFALVRALARQAAEPFEDRLLSTDDEGRIVDFISDANPHEPRCVRLADIRLTAP